ncbi:MAG TPA: hypothetical protein EYN79_03745 [Planctomycetes bacterium]|nr:hypothetical protein [Planctomycetota bacterium]HIN79600.1 hypothetical protein [Planctomycetota bacterium]
MVRLVSLYRRELLGLFVSPVAWIILFIFLLTNGATFTFYLFALDGDTSALLASQYGSISFWFLMVLIPPLLTMRSFAEERRSGTFEMLVTTGIGDGTLVVAKFLSAWSFFIFLWATLLPLWILVARFGTLDTGILLTIHLGLLLVGALFCAAGILASSISSSALIAAGVGMVLDLGFFFVNYLRGLFPAGSLEIRYLEYVSPLYHFSSDFQLGIFDVRYLVLYLTVASMLLFLAVKVLERRRWW